jgi:rare lipoprotein A
MKIHTFIQLIGFCFLLSSSYKTFAQNAPKNQVGYSEMGMASYYPSDEAFRKTLTGDIYDMKALEAAHRNFPLNCVIRVTNLENGKEVILRVNDRPNTTERIMDMTLAAADSLGMVAEDKAVVPVRTEILALNVLRTPENKGVLATAASPNKQKEKIQNSKIENSKVENSKVENKQMAAKTKNDKDDKTKKDLAKQEPKQAKQEVKKFAAQKKIDKPMVSTAPATPKNEKVVAKTTEKTDKSAEKLIAMFKDNVLYDIAGKKQKAQGFGIQTGKFVEISRAITEAKIIETLKIGKVYIQTSEVEGKKMYAVLVGAFKTKEETKEITKQLTEKNYSPFVKPY